MSKRLNATNTAGTTIRSPIRGNKRAKNDIANSNDASKDPSVVLKCIRKVQFFKYIYLVKFDLTIQYSYVQIS